MAIASGQDDEVNAGLLVAEGTMEMVVSVDLQANSKVRRCGVTGSRGIAAAELLLMAW